MVRFLCLFIHFWDLESLSNVKHRKLKPKYEEDKKKYRDGPPVIKCSRRRRSLPAAPLPLPDGQAAARRRIILSWCFCPSVRPPAPSPCAFLLSSEFQRLAIGSIFEWISIRFLLAGDYSAPNAMSMCKVYGGIRGEEAAAALLLPNSWGGELACGELADLGVERFTNLFLM